MNAPLADDLVSRLRDWYEAWGSPPSRDHGVNEAVMAWDCKEAADEIGRLHANAAWAQGTIQSQQKDIAALRQQVALMVRENGALADGYLAKIGIKPEDLR